MLELWLAKGSRVESDQESLQLTARTFYFNLQLHVCTGVNYCDCTRHAEKHYLEFEQKGWCVWIYKYTYMYRACMRVYTVLDTCIHENSIKIIYVTLYICMHAHGTCMYIYIFIHPAAISRFRLQRHCIVYSSPVQWCRLFCREYKKLQLLG